MACHPRLIHRFWRWAVGMAKIEVCDSQGIVGMEWQREVMLMNKKYIHTIVLWVIFGGMVVWACVLQFWPESKITYSFSLPVVSGENVTNMTISKGGDEVTLIRQGTDTWAFANPEWAMAKKNVADTMSKVFKGEARVIQQIKVDEKTASTYGFDKPNAIRVRFTDKDKTVVADLVIGKMEKGEKGEPDTFVKLPDADVAYRISGDLRKPFDMEMKDVRDAKLFALKANDVSEITISNPLDKEHPEVVLTSNLIEPPEEKPEELPKDPNLPPKEPKKEREWSLTTPSGYKLDNLQTYVSGLANLSAREYFDPMKVKAEETGLTGPDVISITFKADEKTYTIKLGNEFKEKGEGDKEITKGYYCSVDGRAEVYLISAFSAETLKTGLNELRLKKIFDGIAEADIVNLVLKEGDQSVSLKKEGGRWEIVSPTKLPADKDAVDELLKGIVSFRVDKFITPKTPAEAGLDKPTQTIAFTTAKATTTIIIGKSEENKFYGTLAGSTDQFLVSSFNVKKFQKSEKDLRDKVVLNLDKEKIVSVEIRAGNELMTLTKTQEKLPSGSLRWDMAGTEKVEGVREAAMNQILGALQKLKAADFYEGKALSEVGLDDPAFQLAVTMEDGKAYTLGISTTKENTNPYATGGLYTGKVFTLNATQANYLQKRPNDFKNQPEK
jgi:hypothetical protein